MKTPTNAKELRNNLLDAYSELRSDQISIKAAAEVSNLAGKITGTIKLQLEYAKLRKEKPDIEFLNCG